MKKKKAKAPLIPEQELLKLMAAQEEDAKDEKEEKAKPTPQEKMQEDVSLFHSLFPDVDADDIPQEVWDRVEAGESLSANYALFVVKKYREEERIQRVNEENGKKAAPCVQSDPELEEYFSPEAVKGMTREEVRKNYHKILSSMEKWN